MGEPLSEEDRKTAEKATQAIEGFAGVLGELGGAGELITGLVDLQEKVKNIDLGVGELHDALYGADEDTPGLIEKVDALLTQTMAQTTAIDSLLEILSGGEEEDTNDRGLQ